MKFQVLIYFALFISACQSNKENQILKQNWNKSTFNNTLELLLKSDQIKCEEYLNYLSYPTTTNQFRNESIKKVLAKLDTKAAEISIDSKFNYKHKNAEIKRVEINKDTEEIEILIKTINQNNYKEKIDEIQIDIWLSKFWPIGTYTYNTFEEPIINSNRELENKLFLPIKYIREYLSELGYSNQYVPYDCLIYKIKNIEITKKASQ